MGLLAAAWKRDFGWRGPLLIHDFDIDGVGDIDADIRNPKVPLELDRGTGSRQRGTIASGPDHTSWPIALGPVAPGEGGIGSRGTSSDRQLSAIKTSADVAGNGRIRQTSGYICVNTAGHPL